jgi:uncharacterized protein YcfL
MRRLHMSGVVILAALLLVLIGCSSPTPTPGKSHLLMARVRHDDSISIKADETKSLDVILETRKSGPGTVIYEISEAPEGLDVTIEPSQFMAQPETIYHSTITVKASPELQPGEYRLSFGQNFEKVFSGVGWIEVSVE